jgi:hypothetical protein
LMSRSSIHVRLRIVGLRGNLVYRRIPDLF